MTSIRPLSPTLIVIAKRPVAGRVKTRLVPPLTAQQAADVAAAALTDTLATVGATPAARHLLAFDGDPDGWTPAGWDVCAQVAGGLDRRLAGAFDRAGTGPALLVGMDTPQLQVGQLTAFDPSRYDAGLGRANDGGYWAIGFRDARLARAAVLGIAMSTATTGRRQLARLHELGLRVQLLDELTDVDTIDSAREVSALVPGSTFARALQRATARDLIGAVS